MKKRKIKQGANVIIGALIFLFLVGYAFSVSFLFGVIFFVGFIWETSSGRLKKQPFLAAFIFLGGLITRIALDKFLRPIFISDTMIDLLIAIVLFLGLILLGHKVKKS